MKRLSELKKHEELRKLFHITVGCLIAAASLYVERNIIIGFLLLGLVADLLLRNKIHAIQDMIDVGRRTYGDWAYIAGIIVAAAVFQRPFAFIAACLALALGDGLAGLIGRLYGKHHFAIFGADKTILGSTVFFAVVYVVVWHLLIASLVDPETAFVYAAIIAGVGTITEASIGYGLDNFAVPLVTGALFALLV